MRVNLCLASLLVLAASCSGLRDGGDRPELLDAGSDAGGAPDAADSGDGDSDGDDDAGPADAALDDDGGADSRDADAAMAHPGDARLVISEIDYEQPGEDRAEWIEIYNRGASAVTLEGYELVLGDGASGMPYRVVPLDDAGTLAPQRYLVVGADGVVGGLGSDVLTVALGGEAALLENGRGADGAGAGDAVFLIDRQRDVILDRLAYEGVATIELAGFGAVSAVEGDEPATALDADSFGSNGTLCRLPQGADSDDAYEDWHTCTEPTPGAANVRVPRLIINEVDAKHGSNELEEYVELANVGEAGLSLRGIQLLLVNQAGRAYRTVSFEAAGTIASNGYAVVGSERALEELGPENSIIDLGYQSDWILHEEPAGVALVDAVSGTLLDAVSYGGQVTSAMIPGVGVLSLVEGAPLTAVDTGAATTLCRAPDATDTNDAASDWKACSAPSAGFANITP